MDINYDEIIEFRIIEKLDSSIVYVGMYGEDFFFTPQGDNKWVFSSHTLHLDDIHVDDIDKRRILIHYCIYGNPDFNYKKAFLSRIDNSYKMTKKIYNKYLEAKDDKYLKLLSQEINNISAYKLSKKHFKDWIIAGYDTGLTDVPKDKIKIFLKLYKASKKKKKRVCQMTSKNK